MINSPQVVVTKGNASADDPTEMKKRSTLWQTLPFSSVIHTMVVASVFICAYDLATLSIKFKDPTLESPFVWG